MRQASVKQEKPPEISAIDFIHGKDYIDAGKVVNFDDESWYIPQTRGQRATIHFRDLPGWITRPAKLTLAHGWLMEGRSISWLNTRMVGFRRLAKWLVGFKGPSFA